MPGRFFAAERCAMSRVRVPPLPMPLPIASGVRRTGRTCVHMHDILHVCDCDCVHQICIKKVKADFCKTIIFSEIVPLGARAARVLAIFIRVARH